VIGMIDLISALGESDAFSNPLSVVYLICKHWGPVIAGGACGVAVIAWVGREARRDMNE